MTLVIDYNAGNLRSVENALGFLDADYEVVRTPEAIPGADRIIFPGVGEAASAMSGLRKSGMDKALVEFAASGRPFLGICLGSQIILDASGESDTRCLGLVAGSAREFPGDMGLKVPHMGWNNISMTGNDPVFNGIPDDADFYFVHSYYPGPEDPSCTIATCRYGISFTAALKKDNIYAFQFHPEKSGPYGLRLLANFLSLKGDLSC